jgi:urocanate reductase
MTQQGNGLASALSRRTFLRNSAGAAGLAAAAAATTSALGSGCDTVDDGWDDAADVVVMGAGGAGLVAAITAAEAGGDVLVIEKADLIGGTTALSGGQVQASGTPLQLAHVDDDTAARHAAWWLAASEGIADPEILALLADEAPHAIAFMENLGMTYSGLYGVGPMPTVSPELYRDRIHIPDTGGSDVLAGGAHHVALLRARAEALGVRFQLEASVDGLYRHHHDEIVGVRMRRQLADGDEEHTRIRARRGVILCAGGFDHNREMSRAHSPQQLWELEDGVCWCVPTNTGDGIRLGMAAGGDLASGMSATIGYPMAVMGTTDAVPGLWVNVHGQRFVAEDAHYAFAMRTIFSQERHLAWAIFDEATAGLGGGVLGGLFGGWSEDLSDELADGTLVRADTLEALADALGCNGEQLQATVNLWNRDMARDGTDSLYARTRARVALGDGPFWAVRIRSANLGSCGGLRINTHAQVRNRVGETIRGLYAAGMCAGGFIGTFYPGSGTAVMATLVLGRRAGLHVMGQHTTDVPAASAATVSLA